MIRQHYVARIFGSGYLKTMICFCNPKNICFPILLFLFIGQEGLFAQSDGQVAGSGVRSEVYRVQCQRIPELDQALRTRFLQDPGFTYTIQQEGQPNVYRLGVLGSETTQKDIVPVLGQYAAILPRSESTSVVSLSSPSYPNPMTQSPAAGYDRPLPIPATYPPAPAMQAGYIHPQTLPVSPGPPYSVMPEYSVPQVPAHAAYQLPDPGLTGHVNGTVPTPRPVESVVHSTPHPPLRSNVPNADESRDSFSPTNVPIARIEQELYLILGDRLAEMAPSKYLLTVQRKELKKFCTAEIDRANNRILFLGDKALCSQMVALVNALDQPEPPTGRMRRFIPIPNSDTAAIEKILQINRSAKQASLNPSLPNTQAYPQPVGFPSSAPGPVRPIPSPANLSPDAAPRIEFRNNPTLPQPLSGNFSAAPKHLDPQRNPVIQLVGYQFQGEGLGGGFDVGGAGGGVDAMSGQGEAQVGMEVATDFRYEILDDLDVVIIDATGAEVARFEKMIREIEKLSERADPKIEIYNLKHVNCSSLQWVIIQIYADVFRTKEGAVRSIPMIHPNAMLLVGWGNALEAMKQLIETLDRPVAAENSLLKVFPLKHASAQYVQSVIRNTFPIPPAMNSAFMPRLQVFVDSRTNALIVQAGQNDLNEIERIIREIDVVATGPKLRLKTFQLKHTMAADIVQVLTTAISSSVSGTTDQKKPALELLVSDENGRRMIESGIMSDVRISPDARTNQLIVTAPEHCLPLLEELIKMLDTPSATAVIKVFQLQYADANSMVPMLRSLIPTQTDGVVGPQLPGSKDEDALVPVRFAVDRRTNSILAAGSTGDLQIIEALLYSLDREDQQSRIETVYPLRSMMAKDVALAINAYLVSKRKIQMDTPGVISAYQQIESEVIIVPEMVSNTLIVSATPKYHDDIIKLIKELDQSPPQVVIQVLIGEVTLANTDEFGAEFGIQDSLLFNRSTFNTIEQATRKITQPDGTIIEEPFILNGSANPGWLFNDNPSNSLGDGWNSSSAQSAGTVGSQLLTNFATGRVGAESGFGGVVFSANSDAVSILIRALQETSRLEVLSRPQIMAMNNQPATIHVGQDVPRVQGTTTTNYGESMNVEDEKVGLQLIVVPSVSPEGEIVMKVYAQKSKISTDATVVGYSEGKEVRSPAIDTITTQTVINATDNETVVLGGLITKEDQKLHRKVPLLGDIPVVGKLFSYEYNRCRRSELLIILTPRIVRNEKDREEIKRIETARMNWCLGNVTSLHGDIGAYNNVSAERPYAGDAEVIFPESVDPDSLIPLEEMSDPPHPRLAPENGSGTRIPVPTLPKKTSE